MFARLDSNPVELRLGIPRETGDLPRSTGMDLSTPSPGSDFPSGVEFGAGIYVSKKPQ
ncbi:hypothetical protein [Mesorhizobium carmichaelinearum]|uniref:hypothetical protein n=1 Tax=Mesorhizobium carmichaelinearum TaxID=1208188 RepID=UPI0015CD0B14|nr:hypothetical protein [Mesorhizobium carmichaelinearum]